MLGEGLNTDGFSKVLEPVRIALKPCTAFTSLHLPKVYIHIDV